MFTSFTEFQGLVPSVVVGVVGIGHVDGIRENWSKDINVTELVRCVTVIAKTRNWVVLTPF